MSAVYTCVTKLYVIMMYTLAVCGQVLTTGADVVVVELGTVSAAMDFATGIPLFAAYTHR